MARNETYTANEIAWHKEAQARGGVNIDRFEVYYGDGVVVSGTSAADWVAAPDDNVQAVIWLRNDLSIEWLFGMDDYNWLTHRKTGRWMERKAFRELMVSISDRSDLV